MKGSMLLFFGVLVLFSAVVIINSADDVSSATGCQCANTYLPESYTCEPNPTQGNVPGGKAPVYSCIDDSGNPFNYYDTCSVGNNRPTICTQIFCGADRSDHCGWGDPVSIFSAAGSSN